MRTKPPCCRVKSRKICRPRRKPEAFGLAQKIREEKLFFRKNALRMKFGPLGAVDDRV